MQGSILDGDGRVGRLYPSVEKIAQEPLLLVMVIIIMMITVMVFFVMTIITVFWGKLRLRPLLWSGALNNFVQLASVKPDAPALGAIIDFNSLSFRHDKGHIAYGTVHPQSPLSVRLNMDLNRVQEEVTAEPLLTPGPKSNDQVLGLGMKRRRCLVDEGKGKVF